MRPTRQVPKAAALVAALVLPLAVAGTGWAQPPGDSASSEDPGPSRGWVVSTEPAVRTAGAGEGRAAELRARVEAEGAHVYATFSQAVEGFAADLTDEQARWLAEQPGVVDVVPDMPLRFADTQDSPPSWGLDRIDQAFRPLDGRYVYPPSAGSGVRVYVVDSGVDATHPDLEGRVATGFTTYPDDPATQDCDGHGTHVAGTAAGTTYGVAKAATVVPVRVFSCDEEGWLADLLVAVDWIASNHPDDVPGVVNMSLTLDGTASVLDDAVARLVTEGLFVAVAAGNEGLDACDFSPARASVAFTVGATDDQDRRANFSNRGSCVDGFAPGVGIVSAVPRSLLERGWWSMDGTSMASPHVAGVAALHLGVDASLTPAAVTTALLGNASPVVTWHPVGTNLLVTTRGMPTEAPTVPATYVAVDPVRVMSGATLGAKDTRTLKIPGAPAGATAVVLNLTSHRVTGTSYVSACPAGTSVRTCSRTSAMNPRAATETGALVTVALGGPAGDSVLLDNNAASVRLHADVQGFYVGDDSGGVFAARTPRRVLDTRFATAQATTITLPDVPAGATAVAVNLTSSAASTVSFVSACPAGQSLSACKKASNLNPLPGRDLANAAVVKLGGPERNQIVLYNNRGPVRLIVDVTGYFVPEGDGGSFVAGVPVRAMPATPVKAGATRTVTLTDVPEGASAVALNVTSRAAATSVSFVSACPGGTDVRQCRRSSLLNPAPGVDLSNTVLLKLGGPRNDQVVLYNDRGTSSLIVDVQGYFVD